MDGVCFYQNNALSDCRDIHRSTAQYMFVRQGTHTIPSSCQLHVPPKQTASFTTTHASCDRNTYHVHDDNESFNYPEQLYRKRAHIRSEVKNTRTTDRATDRTNKQIKYVVSSIAAIILDLCCVLRDVDVPTNRLTPRVLHLRI